MSKAQKFIDDYKRMTSSRHWNNLDPQKKAEVENSYESNLRYYQDLDRQESSSQLQAAVPAIKPSAVAPTLADSAPIKPYEPPAIQAPLPSSSEIAQKFIRIKNSKQWDSLSEEQQIAISDQARTAHRNLLANEGFDPAVNAKQIEHQEVFKPYMAPAAGPKEVVDGSVGGFLKAAGKSAMQAVPNIASTIIGAAGAATDIVGKGAAHLPGLGTVGKHLSQIGQDTIGVSNVMDSWANYYLPPEQKSPENLKEFSDMTTGQKLMLLADQGPKQLGTMLIPAAAGAKFGQAAVAGMKGQKAAGVLAPLTNFLASKGPQGAQALGALAGSTMQSASEISKQQMQETGDTNALATLIAAPIAGKLESLVPASAEYLVGGLKGATRKAFSEAMKSPVKFLLHTGKEMAKSGATESLTELAQESVQKYAVEFAKGKQGTGIADIAAQTMKILKEKGYEGLIEEAKTNKAVGELAMAAILGGITGGVFEGAGRSFAGAKYMASPVRHYDNLINAKTDEEKKMAAEAFEKLSPLAKQQAREEAAFRSVNDLDDAEADEETVAEALNVLKEVGPEELQGLYSNLQKSGWVPNEKHQERLAKFFKDQGIVAPETPAPMPAQENGQKPVKEEQGKASEKAVAAGDDYYANIEKIVNDITGGQGKEYDNYLKALEDSPEPEAPESLRNESPAELTKLFPPEDLITKTGQNNAGKEIQGKGWSGKPTRIRAGENAFEGEYAVVELNALTRNKQMGALQNRDRTRAASSAQIDSIAANPDPDKLISADLFANDGPMVVGPDFVVESGNGRSEGLSMAYDKGNAEKYRQALIQRAEEYGIPADKVLNMNKPALVRIRSGELDEKSRAGFVATANAPRQLQRSQTEKAMTDGQAILPFLNQLETQNLNTKGNSQFFTEFFSRVATPEEAGSLTLPNGDVSVEGLNRVRNAVFAAAYGNPEVLVALTEDPDPKIKSILGGLQESVVDTARLTAEANQKAVYPVSINEILPGAARKVAQIRQSGTGLEEYLMQGQFGKDNLSPAERILFGFFATQKSSQKVGTLIKTFNDIVRSYGPPGQMAFPGMEAEIPTADHVLMQAIKKEFPELVERTEKWAQGPAALSADFSKKKAELTGNEKLIQILEQIGTKADPETAKASNRLVDIINAIGPDPETLNANIAKSDNEMAKNGQKGVPYFSVPNKEATSTQISREELDAVAKDISKNLDPAIKTAIKTVETTKELSDLLGRDVPDSVEGALVGNSVYLVRENLPDAKRAKEVAAHEIIGHKGLAGILGREWESLARSFANLGKSDQKIASEIENAMRDYSERDALGQIDEALARTAERYAENPSSFSDKAKVWFNDSLAKIQDSLRALGFDIKFNARDLARTIRAAKSAVTRSGEFSNSTADQKYRDMGTETEAAWKFAKKNAGKILFSYKRAEDFPEFNKLSQATQEAIRKDLKEWARGNKQRVEEARKNARTETPIRELLEFEHSTVDWAPFMFIGKNASIDAFNAAKSIVKNNPNLKVFRVQVDIKNQKGLNDFMGGDEDKADKVFLKRFAELFKNAVDKVSGNSVFVKKGGDDWDAIVVAGKDVTEEDFQLHLENANRKVIIHAISQKLAADVANARAEEPSILGESLALNYELSPGDSRLVDLTRKYASKLWKYLTARGIGFRIGVVEANNLDFDQTNTELVDQHHKEKTGETLDAKSRKALRRNFQKSISLIRRAIAPERDRLEGKRLVEADRIPEGEKIERGRIESNWGVSPQPSEYATVLPSRLEQLIQQIGPDQTQDPKSAGNKLVDIISSIETDVRLKAGDSEIFIPADPPKFSKKASDRLGAKQLTLDLLLPADDSVQKKEEAAAPVVDNERFYTTTTQIKVGTFKHNLETVKGHKDVATILAPLTKDPREQSAVLALNEKGKPLAILRVASGERGSVSMNPHDVFGGVLRVPGVKSFYIVHNHPSGNPKPSSADKMINDRFVSLGDGIGVKYNGSVILSHDYDSDSSINATFNAPDGSVFYDKTSRSNSTDKKKVDAIKSEFASREKPKKTVTSASEWLSFVGPNPIREKMEGLNRIHNKLLLEEAKAKEEATLEGGDTEALKSVQEEIAQVEYDKRRLLDESPKKALVALTNHSNEIVARLEMDPEELAELRQKDLSKGAGKLLQAIDRSNATGMIVHVPHKSQTKDIMPLARNLERFANGFDLRMLDVTSYPTDGGVGYVSARENGLLGDDSNYIFFSKKKSDKPADQNSTGVKYSYGGKKASARPTNVSTWEKAKKLLDSGMDPEVVRAKTGWFVNPYDKQPRFEIDDSRAEFKIKLTEKGSRYAIGKLGTLLKHKELFQAYPELENMLATIDIDPEGKPGGSYARATSGDNNYFGTEAEIKITAPDLETAKEYLTHELQHAIQDAEGFARGDSPVRYLQEELSSLKDIESQISGLNREMSDALDRGDKETYTQMMEQRNTLSQKAMELMGPEGMGSRDRAMEKYRRSAGEIEARDAEARTDLGREEREEIPPYSTSDYSPDEAIVRYSKNSTGPYFYSEMERTLTKPGMLPKKASKADMIGAIQRHIGKFKKVELDESGLIEHLNGIQEGQVTSQDVADYLDMNRIKVEEKTLSDKREAATFPPDYDYNQAASRSGLEIVFDSDEKGFVVYDEDGLMIFDTDANDDDHLIVSPTKEEAAKRAVISISSYTLGKEGAAKYDTYQLPGGKNYRELLLTFPQAGTRSTGGKTIAEGFGEIEFADNQVGAFRSGHWKEDNVLLHTRFNEREDLDGNRVLFIEEIQSDWHQTGRKKGYTGDLEKVLKPEERELRDIYALSWSETIPESKQARKSELEAAVGESLREKAAAHAGTTPEAPFKSTDRWAMLGMKRMIQWAADNGFDKIAWAPGEIHADRYNLSKQISEIVFEDNHSGGIGRAQLDGPPTSGKLIAYDKNRKKVVDQFIQPEQLEDYIGKEAARKLLEQNPTAQSSAGIGVRQRKLSGVDMNVGGEGMKAFYDGILKNETAKYVKKWGSTVSLTDTYPVIDDSVRDSDDIVEAGIKIPAWTFDITPAMRQGITAGQPLYSKKKGSSQTADPDPFDPTPEPVPTLKDVGESATKDLIDLMGKVSRGIITSTSSEEAAQQPYFKRAQQTDSDAETEFELSYNNKNKASDKKKKAEDSNILSHLEADKNLVIGLIRKTLPQGDLQDWAVKKAARVLAPYQTAKPIERILFTVAENLAYDPKNDTLKLSPGIRQYNGESGAYEYVQGEHAPAAMHFFKTLTPEWQRLMIDRARENEEYRQQFESVIIPHEKAKTSIALLARYRQMNADKSALEGAESEARAMLRQVAGKIDQQEYNDLSSLLDQLLNIPDDRVMKMPTVIEGIIRDAKKDLKSPAALQAELKRLNTNKGHYGYVHHYFESEQSPSQGKAFDAFGNIPNGWIESVPATQKLRSGQAGYERNLLKADVAKAKKEIAAEASNSWMRKVEDQFGLPVEEFQNLKTEEFPEGYEHEGKRRAVVANFGKYKGQEIYLPNNIFDHYQLVRERGIEDPVVRKYERLFQTVEGVADRMNLGMLYHTGKFGRDLMAAPFHIFDFMATHAISNPRELPFLIKAMTKAVVNAARPSTWQKYTPELEGEYSESLPLYNKTDKRSYLTMAGDSIGAWVTKTVPVGRTIAALLEEINLAGAADLPLKRIMRSVGEQLADKRGLTGKARERFVFNVIDDGAFVTQNLPPVIAMMRGQNPTKASKAIGGVMRATIPFLGYSTKLVKRMYADPIARGMIPMGKRLIGKQDPDSTFSKELAESSRPFVWLAMKAFVAAGLGGLIPPEEEGIASEMQDSKFLDPTARTHGRILVRQDKTAENPGSGELWLSTKGFSHLQAIDALADVVQGKSTIRDFSTEFLTIHPGMQYFLDILGLSNSYNEKVSFGAKTGKIIAQAAVPQLLRYGPELAKLWRAVRSSNTIPDARKQNFFTAGLEQLGFPVGEVKVDKDGNVRTSIPWVELVKQIGPNIRDIPFSIVSEAVEAEVKGLDPLIERMKTIQEYTSGGQDSDLSERQFLARVLKSNRWATVSEALKDTAQELEQRGEKTIGAAAKLKSKGAPIAEERKKKETNPVEAIIKRIERKLPKESKNQLEEIIRNIGSEPEKAKKTYLEELEEILKNLN